MKRLALLLPVALAALGAVAALAVGANTTPGASAGEARGVTPQSATLTGKVNPHGFPTAVYFQFGTTARYGKRTATTDAGSGKKRRPVSAEVTGLRPETTYHYRLVTFSTRGSARGRDRTFKTPQIPTTPSISMSPNPIVFGRTASVAGALAGPSVSGKQVALEGRPFPFTGVFQQIGNGVVTSPEGAYTFSFPGQITTQLRVVGMSKPLFTSQTVTQNVALATSIRIRRSQRNRQRVCFYGRVRPARTGNAVLIQRKLEGRWETIGLTLTWAENADFSRFSKWMRLRRGGTFRVVIRTTGGDFVDGVSREVRIAAPPLGQERPLAHAQATKTRDRGL